jgi:hypothetical protein
MPIVRGGDAQPVPERPLMAIVQLAFYYFWPKLGWIRLPVGSFTFAWDWR